MLIENLNIYCKPEVEGSDGRKILHAFPVPQESEQYSAQNWSGYSKEGSSSSLIQYTGEVTEFTGLELYSLHYRGNGGRAYQVLIPLPDKEGYWLRCDLREDALMDTILYKGIEIGGKLNGSFTFVRNGSQTNLVLVGSDGYEIHKKQTEAKKKQRKIKASELKVGHLYSSESKSELIYLGAYYQSEKITFDGMTRYGAPKKYHLFCDEKYKWFQLKKSVHFTYESDNQAYTEEECKELAKGYVDEAIKEMNKYLKSIEENCLKWYQAYKREKYNFMKERLERNAKEEIFKLRNEVFNYYCNSLMSLDKSNAVMDKEYANSLCIEAHKKSLEAIIEYDFLMEEKKKWLSK